MSELGDIYKEIKEKNKIKKENNFENSVKLLIENKVYFNHLSDTHLRVGEFDFWPSTGLFIHVKSKLRGRGVFNLIKELKK